MREEIRAPTKRRRPYLQTDERGTRLKLPRPLTRGSARRRAKKNAHRRKRRFQGVRMNAATRTATLI